MKFLTAPRTAAIHVPALLLAVILLLAYTAATPRMTIAGLASSGALLIVLDVSLCLLAATAAAWRRGRDRV